MADETQTAYAKSAYSDPQNIALAISGVLAFFSMPDVLAIIPLKYMPMITLTTAALGIILRIVTGVRPVANIRPMQVKPVEVKKLELTQQGSETVGD